MGDIPITIPDDSLAALAPSPEMGQFSGSSPAATPSPTVAPASATAPGTSRSAPGEQEAAARAAKKGVVVVRSTRVATGTVGRNVEVNDDETGLVASDELNPQKARVLLMLALLKPRTNNEIQKLFYAY